MNAEKKKRILAMISRLEHRVEKRERQRQDLSPKGREQDTDRTMTLIEEIKVPALETLRKDAKKEQAQAQ